MTSSPVCREPQHAPPELYSRLLTAETPAMRPTAGLGRSAGEPPRSPASSSQSCSDLPPTNITNQLKAVSAQPAVSLKHHPHCRAAQPETEQHNTSDFLAVDPRRRRSLDMNLIEVENEIHSNRKLPNSRRFKIKKTNSKNHSFAFDIAAYLHDDKINEIMNIDGLEKTLDEVLTINQNEMDEIFGCRGITALGT